MSRARASSSELKLEEKRKDMDSPHIGKKVSSFKKAQSKLSQQNWLKMSKNRSSMLTTPELIHPSPNNIARKSDSYSAVFNLVASIFGGSILTLPYAFQQVGFFFGTIILLCCGYAANFSLYILCVCTRRTGTQSYIQVARHAYGSTGSWIVTGVLLCSTLFSIIAFMILARDIWSSILQLVFKLVNNDGSIEFTTMQKNCIMIGCIVVTMPAGLAPSLYALRHISYVGFASAITLTIVLGYRCIEYNIENTEAIKQAVATDFTLSKFLTALPIFSLSFLCQFNVLSIHSGLTNPTRERVREVLNYSLFGSSIVYILAGSFGYFYAYSQVQDDILLNFEPEDKVILVGRLCMGITILIAITMCIHPCRDAFNEFSSQLIDAIKRRCLKTSILDSSEVKYDSLPTSNSQKVEGQSLGGSCKSFGKKFALTVVIFAFCAYFAISIPAVRVVWSYSGSIFGFMVSFGMPAMFYLKIRAKKPFHARKIGASFMLVFAILASISCTINNMVA